MRPPLIGFLRRTLDAPIDTDFLTKLEGCAAINADFETHALDLVRTLTLQYPVPFDEAKEALAYFRGAVEDGDSARETQELPTFSPRAL